MSVHKEKRERLLALAGELANDFATRAAEHDQNNTFPFENVARLKETGYTALVLPEDYGGFGADLGEARQAEIAGGQEVRGEFGGDDFVAGGPDGEGGGLFG